ncbi:hypothetical protein [Rubrivirga sp.]|uniref:hypothetical protein n=1 Tax=Rubrivirga sp. TaxID=1885344 RepID=UPI003C783DFC
MSPLFAFWAVGSHGRPLDPAAHTPGGEPSALDALEAFSDESGPWLTIVDDTTDALVWAGDASDALRTFVDDAEAITDCSSRAPGLYARALEAAFAVAEASREMWIREAALEWRYPDPETYRGERLPEYVRRSIRERAEVVGRKDAEAALRHSLLALVAPARRAA